ncbi:hypothetical protein [Nocardia nova]|uniref:hypothetical protein n=1 Tax=Nocardia nova TaxID=37330 RepID=UPI0011B0AAB1|nr:hypothetical protein [Nocardia nova]
MRLSNPRQLDRDAGDLLLQLQLRVLPVTNAEKKLLQEKVDLQVALTRTFQTADAERYARERMMVCPR